MKRIKYLLASALLIFSTLSISGCDNAKSSSESKKNKTTASEKKDSEGNNENQERNTDNKNNDKEVKNDRDKNDSQKNDIVKEKEIIFYTYDINTDVLTPHLKRVKEKTVKSIVKELESNKVVPRGTDVKKAEVKDINGVKTLIVDMNENLIDFKLGSSAELLMLQCLTNSFIKTFNVKQVKLTVEGQNYSSGHIALKSDEYLTFK